MTALYELSRQYLDALDFLTDPENEIDEQTMLNTMEGLKGEVEAKILAVAKFVEQIEHDAEGLEAAARRITMRQKTLENKAAQMRDYIKINMELSGIKKASDSEVSVSLAKLPASVNIVNEELIPDEFWTTNTVKEISKTAIKNAGGCPGAVIESKGFRVSIK